MSVKYSTTYLDDINILKCKTNRWVFLIGNIPTFTSNFYICAIIFRLAKDQMKNNHRVLCHYFKEPDCQFNADILTKKRMNKLPTSFAYIRGRETALRLNSRVE